MILLYIAGKYTDDDYNKIDINIRLAKKAALEIIKECSKLDIYPITPHLNTCHFEQYEDILNVDYTYWLKGSSELLKRCDAIYMLESWKDSGGATEEKRIAEANGMPIFYTIKDVKEHYEL